MKTHFFTLYYPLLQVLRSTSEEVTTPRASRRTPVIEGSADEVAVALDFQSDKEEIDYVSLKKEESK